METLATWRGRVPAWECDADGRWSLRHVAGAFDQAARICAGQAEPAWPLTLRIDPTAGPCAGELVEIRSRLSGDTLEHVMIRIADDAELSRAQAAGPDEGPVQLLEPVQPHAVAGPLDIVDAWECDVMGHMNVQFYASRVTDAEAMFAARLDSGAAGAFFRPREHRFSFLSELLAGNVASAATMRIERPHAPISTRTEIASGGRLCAVAESDLEIVADGGEPGTSAALRRAVDGFPLAGPFKPVWSAGEWSPDAIALSRMTVLGRQEVAAWEVDQTGVMPPRFFFARMAPSVSYLLDMMGLSRPFMVERGLGRAAVAYRLCYRRWPRVGDCLELRSGIGLVGEKSWRFRHCFSDVADGGEVCVVEAVIVLLDLVARRSVALPDTVRQRALAISI